MGGVRKKGKLKRNPFKKEREKKRTRGLIFGEVTKKETKIGMPHLAFRFIVANASYRAKTRLLRSLHA
jgi:hypothetical protein